MKKIVTTTTLAVLIFSITLISGCTGKTELKAPCPNFGSHCDQIPINHWNYRKPSDEE